MGSCSNYSALERHQRKFGDALKKKYEAMLLGKMIISLDKVDVDYYVKSEVTLDDGSVHNVHFRWASQEEDNEGIELPEGDELTMSEFYDKYIINQTIKSVSISYERDDMLYCCAFVTDPAKDDACIEVPIVSIDEIFDIEADYMDKWIKQPAINGGVGGCLNCGYQYDIAPMDMSIAVGFGTAYVCKNGEIIYNERDVYTSSEEEWNEKIWTTQRAEEEAKKDPDNDWRIVMKAPLSGRTYQRHGENMWVLIEKNLGFD